MALSDNTASVNDLHTFRSCILAHPLLVQAKVELALAIREVQPGEIILLVGPTGVGKTVARQRLEGEFTREIAAELRTDRRRLAAATVEAVLDAGEFSWIEHWRRTLLSLDLQPLMVPPTVSLVHQSFAPEPFSHAYLRLMNSVEQALRQRRPRAFFIEEAHHVFRPKRDYAEAGALEILATLAQRTRTPHVLVGGYEMLSKVPVKAGITVIHFPRYRSKYRHEMQFFAAVLRSAAARCPAAAEGRLGSWTEYFYERSAGCVGILQNWLVRALALRAELGQEALERDHLERTAPSAAESESIAVEAVEGERLLTERLHRRTAERVTALAAAS